MLKKYLYHYTSVNSLAMILSSRKFRLNSLTKVDDLSEVKARDSDTIGKYCFVSSWINEDNESMPLWIQYGDNFKGVRIGLPPNPFKQYDVDATVMTNLTFSNNRTILREYTDFNILNKCKYIPFFTNDFLSKVEYTNDRNLLYPKIKEHSINGLTAHFPLLGKYKLKTWSFQNEYRYKLLFFPLSYQEAYDGLGIQKIETEPDIGISDYYLDLEDNFFKMMEITVGPKADMAVKQIVKDLIEKYNNDASYRDSELTDIIR